MTIKNVEKHWTRSGKIQLWICLVVLSALIIAAAFDSRLLVRRYEVDAEEISSPVRIALVTDLHSCRYGEGQAELIEAVKSLNPDLVLLGGDIFDDEMPNANTEYFLAGIADKYPCYYVTGNHEYWAGEEAFAEQMRILEEHHVRILSGTGETIEVNGQMIGLYGLDDPEKYAKDRKKAFLKQLNSLGSMAKEGFAVLLSHRPEFFEEYAAYDFDLVLCGHVHGGQWRILGILNGLYAPDQGWIPQYAGGRYTAGDTTMIVSRGLARESTRIPRIFNRPELVVININ